MSWDAHLLDIFGLPRQPLPQCVPNRHDFGHLDLLGQNIPMQVVMGDLPASLFAAGQPQSDMAYITTGTGAFVQRVMQKEPDDVKRLLTGVACQDGDAVLYSLEGTVNGAGSALQWFQGITNVVQIQAKLPQWLRREGDIPLFLNGVSGLGSPFWKPVFNSRFVGEGEVWQQAVAVLESIVFLLNVNLEGMAAYVSAPAAIDIGGGLAGLSGLCQRLANLAAIPVIRPAWSEATARGCAFLLAGYPGDWPKADKADVFQPVTDVRLTDRYARWKVLMERSL